MSKNKTKFEVFISKSVSVQLEGDLPLCTTSNFFMVIRVTLVDLVLVVMVIWVVMVVMEVMVVIVVMVVMMVMVVVVAMVIILDGSDRTDISTYFSR